MCTRSSTILSLALKAKEGANKDRNKRRNLDYVKNSKKQSEVNKILRSVLFSKEKTVGINLERDSRIDKLALENKILYSSNDFDLDEDQKLTCGKSEDQILKEEKLPFEKSNKDDIPQTETTTNLERARRKLNFNENNGYSGEKFNEETSTTTDTNNKESNLEFRSITALGHGEGELNSIKNPYFGGEKHNDVKNSKDSVTSNKFNLEAVQEGITDMGRVCTQSSFNEEDQPDNDGNTICSASIASTKSEYSGFSGDSIIDPNYVPSEISSTEGEDNESECSFLIEKQPQVIADHQLSLAVCPKRPASSQENPPIELDDELHEVERAQRKNYTDKMDYCMFCEKDISHFARHLFTWHSSELEVERIQSYKNNSKERRDALSKLRKQGNFLKNRTSNTVRPVKRLQSSGNAVRDDFLPCKYCLGYYKKKSLYRHTKRCSQNSDKANLNKRQTAQSDGQTTLLLNSMFKHDQLLKTELFPRMRADVVALTAKKDQLICKYAYSYIKGRKSKGNLDLVRQNVRRLAKLLMFAQKQHGTTEIRELINLLRPYRFNTIVNGVNEIAKYNSETERYESPTLAMNFGTLLKKCCDLGYIHLLQQNIDTSAQRKEMKILKKLVESQWADEVSAQAATNLNENRWNKEELIPLSSDLKKLNDYLKQNAEKNYNILKSDPKDFQAYTSLKEILYTQILLLNRRRPAEVAQIKVETYKSISLEPQQESELSKSLTETEKILLQTYNRIVIRGKRGRGVPVLLSPIMKQHFDYLIDVRGHFISNNNYVFHTSGSNCIDGTKIMCKYANKRGATQPHSITATRLRKHLATVCQLLQFSEKDLEQLSKFMGHTLRTHCNVYRMADSVYQTAKISKLLLLMADGKADQFVGKQLDDIDIDLNPLYENTENTFEELSTIPSTSSAGPSTSSQIDTVSAVSEIDRDEINGPLDESEDSEKEVPRKRSKIKRKKNVPRKRQPWSERQKKVLAEYFATHIKKKQAPKKNECEALRDKHPKLFEGRDWVSMKAVVFNIYRGNLVNY